MKRLFGILFLVYLNDLQNGQVLKSVNAFLKMIQSFGQAWKTIG